MGDDVHRPVRLTYVTQDSITGYGYKHVASLPASENDKYQLIFFVTFDEGIKGYLVLHRRQKT